jgi:tetratricopeptide (TPR) repeat protein
MASHASDFEAALVNGNPFFPDGATVDGHKYVMADGPTENLLVTLSAAARKTDGAAMVTAVPNVYPLIALELGSYYNEIGKPEDTIRVLNEGMSLTPSPESAVGAHAGEMMSEKGAALDSLKRYSEGLDVFDQALASHVLTPRDKARLDRGRGFALTELGRLDDAQAAYRDSLQIEPGNARAQAELGYIARLRAGGPKAPGLMYTAPSAPQKPQ